MFVLIFAVFHGCSGGGDAKVVDFSKTMTIERPGKQSASTDSLRIAVAAMISPGETFVHYKQMIAYIGSHLGKKTELIQRKTYGEINELLGRNEIHLAFICSGPYVTGKDKYGFELVAAPQVKGSHFYHSYLIVNKASSFNRLEDLRGRVFAFTDPDSNTGRLVPTYWLAQAGEKPETFFGDTIYTYSHDNSILAVARGLVDGAAVHGLIWRFYQSKYPEFASRIRSIRKSEPYGIPPLVCSKDLSPIVKERILHLLLTMHQEPDGKAILNELMIDRFITPRDEWYGSIRRMKVQFATLEPRIHAVSNAKE